MHIRKKEISYHDNEILKYSKFSLKTKILNADNERDF